MEVANTKPQAEHGKKCLQTPHTLRLLKLIHEGTPKFAALAVDRLPTKANAAVLWDLLGRLQAILTSTEWKTRQAAARAMEKLGEQLDAEEFLKQDDDKLSLQYVLDNMSTIVSQSPLYGSSRSKYDVKEGDIEEEDVTARILRQRELLAKRLGLDSIGNVLGSDQTKNIPIANEDFLLRSTKRARKHNVADDAILLETRNSFTELLVRQSECGDNALKLLTAELMYRMFHPSWWMRHGAILGLMSLTKAFTQFGSWTDSVLSRALCILALDRFGDFAADTVAPVRETAAQLVATILHIAPIRVRNISIEALLGMVSNWASWEIKQGALLAMKYIFTVKRFNNYVVSGVQASSMVDAAVDGLQNISSDDVVSAAACVLLECNEIVWQAARPLWLALKSTSQCSSSVVQLVSLLKRMAKDDSKKFEGLIGEDPDSCLLELLGSPFLSVRLSTMEVVGAVSSSKEVAEAMFEMHYDSEIPKHIVETSWKSLCSRCHSVPVWCSLLDRYFLSDSQESHDVFPQRSAAALSFMYKSTFSALTRFYLLVMMQSPWTVQCEKSMLLQGYLQEFELTVFAGLLSMDGNLPCMTHNGPELSKVVSLRNNITKEGVGAVLADTDRAEEIASSVRLKLTTLCQTENKPTLFQAMRIRAGIACALVYKGTLPKAITPLLRALVTSFNNETESRRRIHTDDCLCRFIRISSKEKIHEKAVSKIIDMACDISSQEDDSLASNRQQRDSAIRILRSFAHSFQDIPSLWRRLSPLLQPSTTDDEKTSSLRIVSAVAKGFTQSCAEPASKFSQAFVGPLIGLATLSHVLSLVSGTLRTLCELEPKQVLNIAVPKLIMFLKEKRKRTEYCHLLHDLVEASEASIGPFIRVILPEVMALITDQSCGRIANSMFATLVRCAPLVPRTQVTTDFSVIDHLVFGEALPPCHMPNLVQQSLKLSNIALRKYQLDGVSWLRFLQEVNISGALCDDMGLGKTLQALIGVALAHAENGDNQKSLVVCPSTLVLHWQHEIYKYFPCRKVFRALPLIGSPTERATLLQNQLDASNVVIISYSVLRSDIDDLNNAFRSTWCYCVLDEGHLLKNPKTATATAARKIVARHKLILSGTPIQNRVQELWAVFDFLMPNFLGDLRSFEKTFGRPIANGNLEGASAAAIAKGIEVLKLLHQTVLPFILRREKSQVLPELPAMTETIVKVTMSNIQRRFYDSFRQESHLNSCLDTFEKQFEEGSKASQATSNTFKSLLFLRLVCTHPSLVVADSLVGSNEELSNLSSSGKLLALVTLLQEAGILNSEVYGADNDSSLLYCEDDVGTNGKDGFGRVVDPIREATEAFCPLSTSQELVNDHKLSKFLIFAQFTRTLDIIEKLILRSPFMKSRYVRLCGKTPQGTRMSNVKSFQEDDEVRVMILATRVGCLGLNLTAANQVIFIESDYNPQVDIQAIDRTRRIGQKKVVQVYKLVTENSIEESILRMQSKKLKIAKAVVSTENSSIYSLGTDRLLDIFTARTSDSKKEETDLDGMLETCIEDYRSLTASFFENGMKL